jgi:hypothetical protein
MDGLSLAMQRWVWRALQIIYALCVLGLLLLPSHRYDWMRDFDPGFDGALPEDGSGNRWVAIAVLLAGAVTAQLLCSAWLARTPRQRWGALVLGGFAVGITLWRFGLP